MNREQRVRTRSWSAKGLNLTRSAMRRKQSLCGGGAQGAVAITGRAKNVFGGKSVAPLHVALICIVWAGRALQFALKPFCGASAPLLRDVCLAPGVCAACLHCCVPRRRCKAIADVHAWRYTVRAVRLCRMIASRVMHRPALGGPRGWTVCAVAWPIHAPFLVHSPPGSRQLAQFTTLWHVRPLANHI